MVTSVVSASPQIPVTPVPPHLPGGRGGGSHGGRSGGRSGGGGGGGGGYSKEREETRILDHPPVTASSNSGLTRLDVKLIGGCYHSIPVQLSI